MILQYVLSLKRLNRVPIKVLEYSRELIELCPFRQGLCQMDIALGDVGQPQAISQTYLQAISTAWHFSRKNWFHFVWSLSLKIA